MPIGAKVKIDRFSYSIQPGTDKNRCKDTLMIYDGPSSSSTRKAVLCDDRTYNGLVSSKNTIFIAFHSDRESGDEFNGFKFTFSVIGMILYFSFSNLIKYYFDYHLRNEKMC